MEQIKYIIESPTMDEPEQPTKCQITYQKHRSIILAAQKRYYLKNAEAKRAYQKQYRAMKKMELNKPI